MSRVLMFKSSNKNLVAGFIFILCLDLSVRTAIYYYNKYFTEPVINMHESESIDNQKPKREVE